MQNPLRTVIQRVGESEPLLLAHHPSCEYYDHHVIEVYGQRLCMGCFVVYPVSFVSLVTLSVVYALAPGGTLATLPTGAFYAAGAILAAPMVAGKLLPGSRTRSARVSGKALLAVGLAIATLPLVFRPGDRLMTLGLLVSFLVPYLVHKGLTAREDCQGCPEAADFPNCSGMTFDETYRYESDEFSN